MSRPIHNLKTSILSRQLSLAKATLNIGKNIAKHNLTHLVSAGDTQTQKQAMLSEQAQYFAQELGKLKGSVVKIGQMLALYGEHFLPQEVVTALHTLNDNTAALEFSIVYQNIVGELGELAQDFVIDPLPIGTASLAQVHKAVHKATGQQVVLKVQYPKVAEAIDSDLALLRRLLKLSRVIPQTKELDEWFNEIKDLLHREVDYRLECETTQRFFERLAGDERFVVPKIYENYCTKRLICMSFEEGISLSRLNTEAISQERKNALGQAALELVLKELFVWGEMQTDPNFGNYLVRLHDDRPDQIILLDFGAIKSFDHTMTSIAKNLLQAGYAQDKEKMRQVMADSSAHQYPFFRQSSKVLDDLTDVFLLATEGFASPSRLNSPFIDEHGTYDWAASNLYARTALHAKQCMQSLEFSMPPKELMFISRKFIGAFALLNTLNARTDANKLAQVFA